MRPFTVLIGIVLGTASSITFSLGAVSIVFGMLAGRHPELCARAAQTLAEPGGIRSFDRRQRREFPRPDEGPFLAPLGACRHLAVLSVIVFMYWPHRS